MGRGLGFILYAWIMMYLDSFIRVQQRYAMLVWALRILGVVLRLLKYDDVGIITAATALRVHCSMSPTESNASRPCSMLERQYCIWNYEGLHIF